MNYHILYLEDDPRMRRHTTDMLINKGYDVVSFRRIDQAKEYFADNHNNIACVIVDLNMSDEWLGEYRSESQGGIISGWVWLQRYVREIAPNMNAIIYSGYIDFLKEHLGKNEDELLKEYNIRCIKKGVGESDGFNGLVETLRNLEIRD